jgi:hypothetical protein
MGTCYTHESEHHLSDGSVRRFTPRGPTHVIDGHRSKPARKGSREDSVEDWGPGGLAARIFVGLNVGEKPTYTINDVVKATKEIRLQQGALPDATFIAQKGLYTEPAARGGHLITENSVQIIIFDTEGLSLDAFGEKVVQLARGLRERFDQDSVIVELQEGGVSKKVLSVKR